MNVLLHFPFGYKLYANHLPEHGQRPYYSWFVGKTSYGKGMRVSVGGYKLPFLVYYRKVALHVTLFGWFTVSFVRGF